MSSNLGGMPSPTVVAPQPNVVNYGGVNIPLKNVMVTGANAGLGLESCAQLAQTAGIEKVVLACRSKTKGQDAIDKLVKQTGKPASMFEVLVVDTSSNKSCVDAAASLAVPLHGIICNAGGIGTTPQDKMESGALCLFAQNIVGHAVLIEALIASGKIPKGGRIILSVSEQARGIPELSMEKPPLLPATEDHLAALIDGTAIKNFNNEAYGSAKGIGALYIGCMARRHKDYYFLSVSPGGTAGTNIFSFLGPLGGCLMCCLKATGQMHTLDQGALRYIDSLVSTPYPSGKFIASAKGQTGALGDQTKIWSIFADEEAQDAAYAALHRYMK